MSTIESVVIFALRKMGFRVVNETTGDLNQYSISLYWNSDDGTISKNDVIFSVCSNGASIFTFDDTDLELFPSELYMLRDIHNFNKANVQ